MPQRLQRRSFLRTAGLIGSTALWPWPASAIAGPSTPKKNAAGGFPYANKLGWQIGVAQYVFRRFALYETLPKLQKLGVRYIEPAFFLKLDSKQPALRVNPSLSQAQRRQLAKQLADHGICMDSYYTNLTNDAKAARDVFEFAKQMGVKTLVSEPPLDAFDMLEPLCNQYAIDLAIHNHPKPRSKYWNPDTVLKVCQGRSKRIGACCDVGHWARTGLDVVAELKKLQGRIIEVHLKDIVEIGNPTARDVPLGRGNANIGGALRELHRQGFRGLLVVENEYDSPKLMQDVAECCQFVEKTAQAICAAR